MCNEFFKMESFVTAAAFTLLRVGEGEANCHPHPQDYSYIGKKNTIM
jgi:hypothetical protein